MTDRGPLLTVEEVQALLSNGGGAPLSRRFIMANVRPRVDLARGVVRWYRDDVLAWVESRRTGLAA